MDFVSHALVGRALAISPKNSKKSIYWITFFSVLPDISSIILYLHLGFIKARTFWIPLNTDWDGFRNLHPAWSALWEIPHSLFFFSFLILPIIIFFKLPKMALFAYISHILIDLFSHAGEWAVKPFYPLSFKVNGFANAWASPLGSIFFSWLILSMFLVILNTIINKNKISWSKEYDGIRIP